MMERERQHRMTELSPTARAGQVLREHAVTTYDDDPAYPPLGGHLYERLAEG